MFKKTLLSLALIGAGTLGLPMVSASAAALPVIQQSGAADSSLATQINHRDSHRGSQRMASPREWRNWNNRSGRVVAYDRYRHGPRCSRWSNNCRYFYRGYYYGSPWWTLPLVGAGVVVGGTLGGGYGGGYGLSARHVNWCEDRYRSYNVRSNTWVAYSGAVRQCVSPYGP